MDFFTGFQNFGWFLVLIGVMILVHELGHYLAARFFDFRIDAFSIGFGPRIFGFKHGETDFRISAIPFGGYVRMAGEQPGDADDPRGFASKPRWQRLIVVFAGPAINIVLAVVLLAGLYMVKYPKPASAGAAATVGYVKAGTPAAKAGVQAGDAIIQIEDKQAPTWDDVRVKELVSAGKPLPLLVNREGVQLRLVVTPELDEQHGIGTAGWDEAVDIEIRAVEPGMDAERKGLKAGDTLVAVNGTPIWTIHTIHETLAQSEGRPVDLDYRRDGEPHRISITPGFADDGTGTKRWMIGIKLAPRIVYTQLGFADASIESIRDNAKGATLIFKFLQSLIERRSSAKSIEGPIRIAQLSGAAAREGAATFIGLMAMVSLNLAIFNLLPIPILDGGVILLLLIEMFIRRDLSLQFKENVFKLGFVFLMVVVVFVLYNDISKMLPG